MKNVPANVLPPLATVAELAGYLAQPLDRVEARCRGAAASLAQAWRVAAPATPGDVAAFYRKIDHYLYDLTWWHALQEDDSALVQWRALETALAHRARAALDFGSGIGSLGLLLAQQGLAVTLAEINPLLRDYARWRFDRQGLKARFLEPSAIPVGEFDFVSAVDVIEHLPEPRAVLAQLAAALRPGGTLFVHLPMDRDAAHPMHFQHDPRALLGQLQRDGLWVERAEGELWILRRGEPARYRLQPGLELIPGEPGTGGLLFSWRPLMALRLNPQAFALASGLDIERTAAEVAARLPALSLQDTAAFLDSLARRRLLAKTPPSTGRWPSVSIIVPARGRPAATRACVESLLALDYPTAREILVVDDASEPPLGPVLADLPIRLLRQQRNIGQSAARNLAAVEAQGELLAFIDNDCVAEPAWLRTLVPHLDDPAVGIVGGRVISPTPEGWVAAFEAARSPLDMGAVGGTVGPGETVAYLPTCNLIVRRDLLLAQGGFDADMRLGEDVDFIWRAVRGGVEVRYVPEGRIVHYHRVRLAALLRRRADYGSSEADLQRRHPEGRRVMPLPRVGVLLLAMLATLGVAWPASAGLGASIVCLIVGESIGKHRRIRKLGVVVPARRVGAAVLREQVAALYHLSANLTRYYGLPLLAIGGLWPTLLPAVAVAMLVAPLGDYRRQKPALSLPLFVALYWLEMAAYQIGVWRGCWQRRTPWPLLPRSRWGR
ncbi:MAG: mycofactocin biosynthesis glycosyltransferase MftF [Candidatus Competibacter sp.]|nr:mycofactocin biosynthesis glycosyltransferase MftF [Candidatus Competibacter sp.]